MLTSINLRDALIVARLPAAHGSTARVDAPAFDAAARLNIGALPLLRRRAH